MLLTEEDYKEKINSYTELEWKPLLDLIPMIESTNKFGELIGGLNEETGVITLPQYKEDIVVSQFLEIVYKIPIIINFDWGSWDEGRQIVRNESFDFDKLDIPTKCKLITAIVRNDRFCDGALVSAFESGIILKILKSIKKQVNLPTRF